MTKYYRQNRLFSYHMVQFFAWVAVLNLAVDCSERHFAFRGRSGEPPRRFAPEGSPLPRSPAGVFVSSAPIDMVTKLTLPFNKAYL